MLQVLGETLRRSALHNPQLFAQATRLLSGSADFAGTRTAPSLLQRATEWLRVMTAPGSPQEDTAASTLPAHHTGNTGYFEPRFTNPWPGWSQKSFSDVWKWQQERKKLKHSVEGWLEGIPYPKPEDFQRAFPLTTPDWAALANPTPGALQALWVGHATVYVQQGGLNYITDPCLSERCAPVQWAGPKRVVGPAIAVEDLRLPNLDFVLLSHNHYDHLDYGTVKRLYKKYGNKLKWYVPLGIKAWFTAQGIHNVTELDWWQETTHTSETGRQIFVGNHVYCRWGGFVVKTPSPDTVSPESGGGWTQPQTFYFTGDTGYCEVFKEIGQRLGPMDLSAVPIGAYEPRWFMGPQHVDSEEGLQIHRDVKSRRSLAIHCCTWALTDEPLDEPPRLLAEALDKSGGDPDEFVTLQHGQMLVVKDGRTLNQPRLLGPRRQKELEQ